MLALPDFCPWRTPCSTAYYVVRNILVYRSTVRVYEYCMYYASYILLYLVFIGVRVFSIFGKMYSFILPIIKNTRYGVPIRVQHNQFINSYGVEIL